MKIFGIMIVKDEADVISPFLKHAEEWADRIFVYDNGSTDGTWELVQERANDIVVPWKRETIPFHNDLRSRVFNAFRHESSQGDWWCYRMDPDEFYADSPRKILPSVPERYHSVARKAMNLSITREDIEEYDFTGDFEVDVEHIRYMRRTAKLENRFFRYRESVRWEENGKCTINGLIWPQTMPVLHYQWRSPEQIQKRLEKKHIYLQEKDHRKGRMSDSDIDRAPLPPDEWKRRLPPRERCVLNTGRDSWDRLVIKPSNYKAVHDSTFSYLTKRLLFATGLRK